MAKDDKPKPPMSEEEALAHQRKQLMLIMIAAVIMVALSFLAGKSVKEWMSSSPQAPVSVYQQVGIQEC